MCLLCEEKAKAIDKVETQESAATAIQALARQALRLSVMESWLRGCGDKEHPSKVVVLLAKAPAWRHAGLRMDEASCLSPVSTWRQAASGSARRHGAEMRAR